MRKLQPRVPSISALHFEGNKNFATAKNPFLNCCSFITKVKLCTRQLSLSSLILFLVIVPPCSFNEGLYYFPNRKRATEASAWPSFLICLISFKTLSYYRNYESREASIVSRSLIESDNSLHGGFNPLGTLVFLIRLESNTAIEDKLERRTSNSGIFLSRV